MNKRREIIYKKAGLTEVGREEGEIQWMGTDKQWKNAERQADFVEMADEYYNKDNNK